MRATHIGNWENCVHCTCSEKKFESNCWRKARRLYHRVILSGAWLSFHTFLVFYTKTNRYVTCRYYSAGLIIRRFSNLDIVITHSKLPRVPSSRHIRPLRVVHVYSAVVAEYIDVHILEGQRPPCVPARRESTTDIADCGHTVRGSSDWRWFRWTWSAPRHTLTKIRMRQFCTDTKRLESHFGCIPVQVYVHSVFREVYPRITMTHQWHSQWHIDLNRPLPFLPPFEWQTSSFFRGRGIILQSCYEVRSWSWIAMIWLAVSS